MMLARCAIVLSACLAPEALGFLQPDVEGTARGGANTVSSGTTGAASSVAGTLPRVPEAPLPGVAPPVSVPLAGSSAPHTADPVVCGLLGGIIVTNWILACCWVASSSPTGSW